MYQKHPLLLPRYVVIETLVVSLKIGSEILKVYILELYQLHKNYLLLIV